MQSNDLVSVVSSDYLSEIPQKNFWNAYPIAFGIELDFSHIEAKMYQTFFFFIFQLIPVSAQLHFINKFFSGEAYVWKKNIKISLMNTKLIFKAFQSPDYSYDGVAFYPFLEPILLIIFVTISIVFFVYYLIRIFKIKNEVRND